MKWTCAGCSPNKTKTQTVACSTCCGFGEREEAHPKFSAFADRVMENAEAREAYVASRERFAREDERERIAAAIEDAALHVMATVKSNEGAALTAAILERAATIARTEP